MWEEEEEHLAQVEVGGWRTRLGQLLLLAQVVEVGSAVGSVAWLDPVLKLKLG